MDLNEIAIFVKVVQTGSFNQAAKQLGMPRQAFMHFVHKYDLKKLKFGEYKKKMMIFQARQTAQ